MTSDETLTVLAVLKAAYPGHYRGLSRVDAEALVLLWTDIFADDEVSIVAAAVKAFISRDTKGFPPVPGQVKEQVLNISFPSVITEGDAWTVIARAVSNGIYGSLEEFDRLPLLLQQLVGSPSQLRDWAMVSTEQFNTVVRSGFSRQYRAHIAREREFAAFPASTRQLIEERGHYPTLALSTNETVGKASDERGHYLES